MKKIIILCCVFFLVFLGCKNDVPFEEPTTEIPEENENNVEKNKTYLEIKNQSQFDVNIYFNAPSEDSLWLKVPTGKTVKKEISPSQTEAGDSVYIEYEYVVGNIVIPYYNPKSNDCIKILPIYENEINTINLSKISSFSSDSTYIIIQNESSDAVFLSESRSSIVYPYLSKDQWIKPNQDVIYDITGNLNINNYYIGNGLSDVKLDINNIVAGNIYVLRYSSESISLLSIVPLDLSIQDKIWKVSLSQDVGKTLLAGHFTSRKNPSDGYMLFGRQVYSNDEDLIYNSIPYYVFLDSNGDILDEQTISFKDNPLDVKVRRVIDSGDYILACGEKLSSENISSAFIIGIEGLSVYADILVGDKNVVASAQTMVQKEDDCFCVLTYKDKYSENDEYLSSSVALVEFKVDNYSSISSKILWESSDEKDLCAYDLTYDEASDTYVVLTWNDGEQYSRLFFIDGASGTEKFDAILLNTYAFSKIAKSIDGKVILCGSFINQLTDSREACFVEIDVSTGALVNNIPKTFPCKDKKLSSYFNDIIFKNDYIILVGCTDYLYSGEFDDTIPYLVAYDISKDKVIWEQRFDNLKGYEVYSCNNSNLSFIYELYNSNTMHSYIVSAGLLGEIPEETKLTLPCSSSITDVEIPDVSIYFYENATSEEDSYYEEVIFKYGDEITLEDLKDYIPDSFADGYEISGWYEWGAEVEEEIVFPYELNTTSLSIYPKLSLSAPKNLSGKALSNSEIYLEWESNPFADNYDIYVNGSLFVSTSSSSYRVTELIPSTAYEFYVVASNENEKSCFSEVIKVKTTSDVSVYFYENATSEEDSYYEEVIFKYGDEITLEDLKDYIPDSFADGYEISGWYEWGDETEEKISFPYEINTTSLCIYPKICLSAPKNLSGFALSNSEIYLEWESNPSATKYDIYVNDSLYKSTSSTNYTVTDLSPKTTYKFYVVASNENYISSTSNLIQVITTAHYRGDINQVPTSAFRMGHNIFYYNSVEEEDVDYYFMYLDAGNTYEIVWCDSNDGSEVLEYYELYPYADITVSIYIAGETNSSKFNCFEKSNGYTVPYQITPNESGYYVIEVVGNNNSNGYYLIGYTEIESVNKYGLLLSGDIAGDISDAGLPLIYEGEGIYTLTFTYENNMKQWGSPLGTCQFKIRTVAGSWEYVSYGLSSKHPVINGGEVPCIEVQDSNFIVDGFIVGTTYKITVRCTSTGEVFVKINTV